jgi:geranyl-CoA carboxylase alpha subunit
MPKLTKILIANRGEIACRVIRTARAMGVRTVAVYSDADADAPHVHHADEAVRIGPPPVGESYLVIDKLIDACRVSGADAVHPGYGFLSENVDFAHACDAAGITFVGPPAHAIELMGSKRLAKLAMIQAGVPCIPGYQGVEQDDATLTQQAQRIGFPLMVKASAGGGGRGMRLVHAAEQLLDSLNAARSEALSAFGSDELILERALLTPRHIEIQVFADGHGNVVHLGERDCSIQRRHQKVIEEAPSPFVSAELREQMGQAAVNAARACDYRGAGTVEFLVDEDGSFFFLEMNTRLQVEHPVTEMITGLDMVEWQLLVAQGAPLPRDQSEIALDGWAIEARLYAEDPQNDFVPQTGKVLQWAPASGHGLRVDHGLASGQTITPHYDPMVAKVIAHGATRQEALNKLVGAVRDTRLLGVKNNKAFVANILRHPVFARGEATTAFLSDHLAEDATTTSAPPSLRTLTLAAALMYYREAQDSPFDPTLIGWCNTTHAAWQFRLECDGRPQALSLTVSPLKNGGRVTGEADGQQETIDVLSVHKDHCHYVVAGLRQRLSYAFDRDVLHMDTDTGQVSLRDLTYASQSTQHTDGDGRIIAPMDGAILSVRVTQGDQVEQGQTIAVLEAMKMEHQLLADTDGVVSELPVRAGQQVRIRQLVASITPVTKDAAP